MGNVVIKKSKSKPLKINTCPTSNELQNNAKNKFYYDFENTSNDSSDNESIKIKSNKIYNNNDDNYFLTKKQLCGFKFNKFYYYYYHFEDFNFDNSENNCLITYDNDDNNNENENGKEQKEEDCILTQKIAWYLNLFTQFEYISLKSSIYNFENCTILYKKEILENQQKEKNVMFENANVDIELVLNNTCLNNLSLLNMYAQSNFNNTNSIKLLKMFDVKYNSFKEQSSNKTSYFLFNNIVDSQKYNLIISKFNFQKKSLNTLIFNYYFDNVLYTYNLNAYLNEKSINLQVFLENNYDDNKTITLNDHNISLNNFLNLCETLYKLNENYKNSKTQHILKNIKSIVIYLHDNWFCVFLTILLSSYKLEELQIHTYTMLSLSYCKKENYFIYKNKNLEKRVFYLGSSDTKRFKKIYDQIVNAYNDKTQNIQLLNTKKLLLNSNMNNFYVNNNTDQQLQKKYAEQVLLETSIFKKQCLLDFNMFYIKYCNKDLLEQLEFSGNMNMKYYHVDNYNYNKCKVIKYNGISKFDTRTSEYIDNNIKIYVSTHCQHLKIKNFFNKFAINNCCEKKYHVIIFAIQDSYLINEYQDFNLKHLETDLYFDLSFCMELPFEKQLNNMMLSKNSYMPLPFKILEYNMNELYNMGNDKCIKYINNLLWYKTLNTFTLYIHNINGFLKVEKYCNNIKNLYIKSSILYQIECNKQNMSLNDQLVVEHMLINLQILKLKLVNYKPTNKTNSESFDLYNYLNLKKNVFMFPQLEILIIKTAKNNNYCIENLERVIKKLSKHNKKLHQIIIVKSYEDTSYYDLQKKCKPINIMFVKFEDYKQKINDPFIYNNKNDLL